MMKLDINIHYEELTTNNKTSQTEPLLDKLNYMLKKYSQREELDLSITVSNITKSHHTFHAYALNRKTPDSHFLKLSSHLDTTIAEEKTVQLTKPSQASEPQTLKVHVAKKVGGLFQQMINELNHYRKELEQLNQHTALDLKKSIDSQLNLNKELSYLLTESEKQALAYVFSDNYINDSPEPPTKDNNDSDLEWFYKTLV